MSLRDALLQLGFVLIALGAVFATWALLTGPLARFTRSDGRDARRVRAGGPRSGSTSEPS